MTVLNAASGMPEEFSPIASNLETLGAKFRLAEIMGGAARFAAVTFPAITLALFFVGYFALPTWLNIALGLLALAAIVLAYFRWVHVPLWRRPTYGQIARWIEEHAPQANVELHNELINAVLLADEYQKTSDAIAKREMAGRRSPWIPQVLREIERKLGTLDLAQTVPWRLQQRRWLFAGVVLLACLLLVLLSPASFSHAFAVYARPNQFVPRVGAVKILKVEPGNDTVLAGQTVTFVATVEAPGGKVVAAKIDLRFASGKTASYPMTVFGTDNNQYRYTPQSNLAEDVDYIITAGDSQSERFHLTVLPQIHMVSYTLEITPPGYTAWQGKPAVVPGKELTPARGSIEAPLGSTVALTAALDIPVQEAILDIQGGPPVVLTRQADGRTFTGNLLVRESLRYAVRVNDKTSRTLARFPEEPQNAASASASASCFTILALPDTPPTITVTEPARDVDARPGDKLALAAQAADDYGLTSVTLETAKGKEEFKAVKTWPGKAGKTLAVRHVLDLPADQYKYGDVLRYRFVAVDNRALTMLDSTWGPQTTPGQVFTISFNDTAAAAAKAGKLWDQLREKLTALLDAQIVLHQGAQKLPGGREARNVVASAETLPGYKQSVGEIGSGQKKLRTGISTLAREFPFEPSMKLIQKALQVLAVEDATAAVDRAGDITLLSDPQALTPLCTRLRQHQARIIDVLQTLLAIAKSQQEKPTQVADKEGGDLPNEAKKAWEKLKDDLKEFQKEQKKVIDSTADLAKKPKDQFDKHDEQKLKELAAIEDKWEKFLSNRLADMSKVAEQDQANVSLLEEMVQMKVELTMAKDALAQKATEIATALEDNGLENAKSLTTHIERWLMHQPDRVQWKMEEPVAQNDPKMAELPKQLQDMVSDLMDQEEDVTEQMENLASKWADSLDKGAGWDAMEGPISNMSAQGVTGNQMPKDTEIQGRSGEGREGRSSGEMVGAEAEGKGGRRTPTRLTPEPFSSGKVKDKSKDPAGGATGGGKKGGFGGEGLEGPAPAKQMQDDIKRLQGKQAAIRNQTERLQLQTKAQGFNNFKLLEAAVLMKKADEALKQYHYNSALYFQKQAVQSLNTAKVLANGQMHVTADTSPAASTKTQKEMQDALNGVMPKGYADPVKAYFQKLSQDAGKE